MYKQNRGLSSVMILLFIFCILITLITLTSVIVFNIGTDNTASTATFGNISETNEGINITIGTNVSAEKFSITKPNGEEIIIRTNEVSNINIKGGSGIYRIYAIDGDDKQLVKTYEKL